MAGSHASDKRRAPEAGQGVAPLAEWIAAACGLVLVLATLACLVWLGLDEESARVEPRVRVVAIERQGERHHVAIEVENEGTAAAAAVRVEVRLRGANGVTESAEVEFDHLPARSSRTAGVFFRNDPRAGTLEAWARSYRQP
jgi:uncharacterized protein (TIGR02588 family)